MIQRRPGPRGFTLIELVVTLALLGLMAFMVTPLAEMTVRRAQERDLRQALREIRTALDQYKVAADQGLIQRNVGDSGYPPDLATLVTGVRNQKSPGHEPLIFLRRVPRDPFGPSDVDATDTWQLRSYRSTAADPAAGVDVFDVQSRAPGNGLNGVPYREW